MKVATDALMALFVAVNRHIKTAITATTPAGAPTGVSLVMAREAALAAYAPRKCGENSHQNDANQRQNGDHAAASEESELVHHADRSQEADRSRRGYRGDLSRCQP